ncbi:DUF2637 domain-containing protein [Micromonospora sp. NPDC005206]|uniref:DUF2637 domain-containing protein n=1 Tax=Micromonospora sp. NPDC005206 TaxID=3157022 RepID=UPI0033B230B4
MPLPERPSKGAWVVAWSAFAAGIGASLAANIAHAGAGSGARFVAGWAPLALLLCSEVMMRVPAPRHPLLKGVQVFGTLVVAGVAALASYRHMRGLALEYGEDNLTASTLPLSVDGLVLVSSIALARLAQMRREAIRADRVAALAAAVVPVPPAAPPPDPVPLPLPVPLPDPEPLPMPEPLPVPQPPAADPVPLPEPPAADPVPDSVPVPVPVPTPPAADAPPVPEAEPVPLVVVPPRVPLPHLDPVVPARPWPQQEPLPLPPPGPDRAPTPPDAATEELWAAARQVWRKSVAAGEPLTGQALGQRFGRSERWGRNRIKEARAELQAEEAAGGDVAGETDQQDTRVPAGAGVA